jgi:hypothetical protein
MIVLGRGEEKIAEIISSMRSPGLLFINKIHNYLPLVGFLQESRTK